MVNSKVHVYIYFFKLLDLLILVADCGGAVPIRSQIGLLLCGAAQKASYVVCT